MASTLDWLEGEAFHRDGESHVTHLFSEAMDRKLWGGNIVPSSQIEEHTPCAQRGRMSPTAVMLMQV
jgi:hypothetical protein